MISSGLFDEVLIQPVEHGANKLFVVSGYATAAMAFHHLEVLRGRNQQIRVELIIGMCSADGLSKSNHKALQYLMQTSCVGHFSCSYVTELPPVHSKVYVWVRDNIPFIGYIGSANYTQTAFGRNQREVMDSLDPQEGLDYFHNLIPQTIHCNDVEAERLVQIYNDRYYARLRRERENGEVLEPETAIPLPDLVGLQSVEITLLDRSGKLPQRSGLNWGQRPEEHREPNQAYIKLPAGVYNTDFFPKRTIHFTVMTDDGRVLICTRAQDNGKAIHTPQNNSMIGEYFRNRLGIPNGAPVTLNDLIRYGRTDIKFYKIDEETYYMDFSAPVDR